MKCGMDYIALSDEQAVGETASQHTSPRALPQPSGLTPPFPDGCVKAFIRRLPQLRALDGPDEFERI